MFTRQSYPPQPTINTASFLTALRPIQTASVAVIITDTAKLVALPSAMPGTNYVVSFEPVSGLAASFGVSAKTPTSFVLMSVGVAAGSTLYTIQGL